MDGHAVCQAAGRGQTWGQPQEENVPSCEHPSPAVLPGHSGLPQRNRCRQTPRSEGRAPVSSPGHGAGPEQGKGWQFREDACPAQDVGSLPRDRGQGVTPAARPLSTQAEPSAELASQLWVFQNSTALQSNERRRPLGNPGPKARGDAHVSSDEQSSGAERGRLCHRCSGEVTNSSDQPFVRC